MKILIIGSKSLRPSMIFEENEFTMENIIYKGKEGSYYKGTVLDNHVFYISRNFNTGDIAPHDLDYDEMFRIIKSFEVDAIFATCVVGSLNPKFTPKQILVLDQFIDFTKHRKFTSYSHNFNFTDFTEPFNKKLRNILIKNFNESSILCQDTGCYVCVDGPRFETAAEVRAFGILGGDVVGMTLVPEVIFAKESRIPYATVAVISNLGAGLAPSVDISEINLIASECMSKVAIVLKKAIGKYK